jgi:predicted nucleotidyltransferase
LAFSELEHVVRCLLSRFEVYGVVLFGSRARGDYKPWSDYDILIVGPFEKPYLERLGEVLSCTHLPVEPHPYTLEEALEMLSRGCPTIVDALSEGVVLYKTKEFETLEEAYRELVRRGLRRSNTTIVLPKGEW